MFRRKRICIQPQYYLIALIGLAVFFFAADAKADTQERYLDHNSVHSAYQKSDVHQQYGRDMKRSTTVYTNNLFDENTSHRSCDDVLPFVKLALEEFNLLPGVKYYWELTERKMKNLADKLQLNGEISLRKRATGTNPEPQDGKVARAGRSSPKDAGSQKRASLLSFNHIKWNLGLDPGDGVLFGQLDVGQYLNLRGKLGDNSQLGFHIKYPF